jgi:prevent-host-death family protein
MQKVGSRELKNRLGRYLAFVRTGKSLLVTDRGKPVAKLMAVEPSAEDQLEERLKELAHRGYIRLGKGRFSKFKPVRAKGKPASRILIEERR